MLLVPIGKGEGRMKKQSSTERFREWICNGNDCERCPAALDTTTSNENGTEYDFECLAGNDPWDKRCRKPWIIRWILARRGRYCRNHEYDNFGAFWEKQEAAKDALEKALREHIFKDHVLAWKGCDGSLHEEDTEWIIIQDTYKVMCDYEDYKRSVEEPLYIQVMNRIKEAALRPIMFIWSFIGQ